MPSKYTAIITNAPDYLIGCCTHLEFAICDAEAGDNILLHKASVHSNYADRSKKDFCFSVKAKKPLIDAFKVEFLRTLNVEAPVDFDFEVSG